MNLRQGTLLQGGKYRIERYINSGGFGCTYEAQHTMLEKRVAIKEFFVKDFCNRDEATAHVTVATQGKRSLVDKLRCRFVEEAKALARMQHPGIVNVSDVFEENGTAYYVMDYVDGSSLQEILRHEGRFSEERALSYIRQVADALSYVHKQNRLHLDIKPGNIMVDATSNAVLIDFGASKQYDELDGENTSTVQGYTKGFAPPEQMTNDVVKFMPATDIYALGATLHKLLTGVTPPSATLRISGEGLAALPASVCAATANAIEQAMCLNKMQRPQSIEEFLALLDAPAAAADDEQTKVCDNEVGNVNVDEDVNKGESKDKNGNDDNIPNKDSDASSSFSFKKFLWPLLLCVVAVAAVLFYMLCPYETTHKTYTVNGVSFTMVKVDGGTFMMGSPDDDTLAYDGEKPAHQVTVGDYGIGETEVTQALWQAVMGNNPSFFGNDLQRPVEEVSWNDCQLFIEKLNELTGAHFRLPTEAEWEFAARGGNLSRGYKYSGSNEYDDAVWCYENSSGTRAVKTKKPNELGLYDMNGNVWEWCADWDGVYPSSPQVNPKGPSSGAERVFRGGCAGGIENSCRIPSRSSHSPGDRYKTYGFRLALQLDTLDSEFKESRWSSSAIHKTTPLYVATTPSCVAVYVDGEKIGVTPINGLEIPAGQHRVELRKEGYEEKSFEQVFGDRPISINDSLEEIDPEKSPDVSFANGCEYIDLGLSVKWATCNVGATTPYECGERYAWGETGTKLEYTESNSNTYGMQMSCIAGRPGYDVACAKWGDDWRLPTKKEYQELIDKCTWTWTTLNDVNGYRVTGPNGKSIFLPVAGEYGDYWSSTPHEENTNYSYHFYFNGTEHSLYAKGRRHSGLYIRPVLGHIDALPSDGLFGAVITVSLTETTTTTTPTSTTTTVTTTTTTTTSAPTQPEQKKQSASKPSDTQPKKQAVDKPKQKTIESTDIEVKEQSEASTHTTKSVTVSPKRYADFFPVYGVLPGKTTVSDVKAVGHMVEDYRGSYFTNINTIAFWDHDGDRIFKDIYIVHSSSMPDRWRGLGLDWHLSYNEWLALFHRMGFSIEHKRTPETKEYSGRNTLSAEFIATSPDQTFTMDLTFNYGNNRGEGYSVHSKRSLYSISVKLRNKPSVFPANEAWALPVASVPAVRRYFSDFFPVYGVTIGRSTIADVKALHYAVKERNADVEGLTFWDHNEDQILEQIYMVNSNSMPEKWQRLGLDWRLSYDDWLALFQKMGFTIEHTMSPRIEGNALSAGFVATAPDGSFTMSLNFNYGNENGEGHRTSSRNSLYSITIEKK